MYKVRRFSQCLLSDIDIKWYCCDEYQKEFNVIGDLYRKGKSALNKPINKVRKKVADKIMDSLERDKKLANEVMEYDKSHGGLSGVVHEPTRKFLDKEANRLNTEVFNFKLPHSKENSVIYSKVARKKGYYDDLKSMENEEIRKKAISAADNNKNLIFNPSTSGIAGYAHELGHVENHISKNPIKRAINELDSSLGKEDIPKGKGLGLSLKNFIKGKIHIAEESNASKNAIDMLNRAGTDKVLVDDSKEALDMALKGYKARSNVSYKLPLYRSIKPKE